MVAVLGDGDVDVVLDGDGVAEADARVLVERRRRRDGALGGVRHGEPAHPVAGVVRVCAQRLG